MRFKEGDIIRVDDFYGRIVDIEEDKNWFTYKIDVLRNGETETYALEVELDLGLIDRHAQKLTRLEKLILLGIVDGD